MDIIYSKDEFFGMMFHITLSLKLFIVNKVGLSSHSQKLALIEAKEKINNVLIELVEATQGSELRTLDIKVPKTEIPENLMDFIQASLIYVKKTRKVFEETWQQTEIDKIEMNLSKLLFKIHFEK